MPALEQKINQRVGKTLSVEIRGRTIRPLPVQGRERGKAVFLSPPPFFQKRSVP